MTMATSTKPTVEEATHDPAEDVEVSETAEGIETEKGTGMRAYVADRNLAEVNANVVFYMDPRSDLGKRLLASGYVTETADPQA